MSDSATKTLTLWSPIIIILVAFVIAFLGGNVFGVWVWVPIVIANWCLIALFVWLNGGKPLAIRWLSPSQGAWYWHGLALIPVLPLLPFFIINIHFYSEWWILLLTIGIALVNPWFEEAYWRGLLLDRTSEWSYWLSLLYSTVLFTLNHLPPGVHSIAIRYTVFAVFPMGLVWGIVYKKTKSLRWPILGHFLVNIFAQTIPAYMNLLGPSG